MMLFVVVVGCSRPTEDQTPNPIAEKKDGNKKVPNEVKKEEPNVKTPKKEEPINKVPVKGSNNIWSEYDRNAIAADLKYKGKLVEFEEDYFKSGSDPKGYFIRCRTVSGIAGRNMHGDLICYFPNSEAETIAKLKWGIRFVVQGVCQGKFPSGGTYRPWSVVFTNCQFIKIHPIKKRNSR